MSDWLQKIEQNLAQEKLFSTATIISGNGLVGSKLLIYPDGAHDGELQPTQLQQQVIADARELMRGEISATRAYGDTQIFIEVFAPSPKLIVVGAVHTAIPLVQFGKILGFRTIVVDGRARFATRERFPDVDQLIVEWPDEALPKLQVNESTYVVVLTHDPKFDIPTLKTLSTMNARYIGAIGSRKTRREHMQQLRAQGLSEEFLQTVYGPIGLDIGARTPEEVALSIMAEIIAARYGRRGGHLKEKSKSKT